MLCYVLQQIMDAEPFVLMCTSRCYVSASKEPASQAAMHGPSHRVRTLLAASAAAHATFACWDGWPAAHTIQKHLQCLQALQMSMCACQAVTSCAQQQQQALPLQDTSQRRFAQPLGCIPVCMPCKPGCCQYHLTLPAGPAAAHGGQPGSR